MVFKDSLKYFYLLWRFSVNQFFIVTYHVRVVIHPYHRYILSDQLMNNFKLIKKSDYLFFFYF